MSKRSSSSPPAEAPLRLRLVLGWSLFFVLVVLGIVYAFWHGPATPVLRDVMPS